MVHTQVNSLQARAGPLKAQKFDLVGIHRTNKTYAKTKTNTGTYTPCRKNFMAGQLIIKSFQEEVKLKQEEIVSSFE